MPLHDFILPKPDTNSTVFDFLVIFCSFYVYSLVPGVWHQCLPGTNVCHCVLDKFLSRILPHVVPFPPVALPTFNGTMELSDYLYFFCLSFFYWQDILCSFFFLKLRKYRLSPVDVQSLYYMNRSFRRRGAVWNLTLTINPHVAFPSDHRVGTPIYGISALNCCPCNLAVYA